MWIDVRNTLPTGTFIVSMQYQSVNPFTNQELKKYTIGDLPDFNACLKAQRLWKGMSISERSACFERLANLMTEKRTELARLITSEMGKPLAEAVLEIKKSASAVRYYQEHAATFLEPQNVKTDAMESFIVPEPLGLIFLIMPWNFPFWQVFRCAVPALFSGNGILLKHAPNVPQCAEKIEELFALSGFPEKLFSNYFLTNEAAAKVLAHPLIAGLSFTGSDHTGAYLSAVAGKHLKKSVMELGGNDAFVVLEDADLELAVNAALRSRSMNAGQTCNAAKRFIAVGSVANDFIAALIAGVRKLIVGDPLDPASDIGPLARKDLADKVRMQVSDSIRQGAIAHFGMKVPAGTENFVQPVVLTGTGPGMRCYEEEVFGPVWTVITAKNEEDAIGIANDSVYGLGASLWTGNVPHAKRLIPFFEAGNVFVNDFVRSDPALPFGGIKRSGYGRELSKEGMMEFVNRKTVYIR